MKLLQGGCGAGAGQHGPHCSACGRDQGATHFLRPVCQPLVSLLAWRSSNRRLDPGGGEVTVDARGSADWRSNAVCPTKHSVPVGFDPNSWPKSTD